MAHVPITAIFEEPAKGFMATVVMLKDTICEGKP